MHCAACVGKVERALHAVPGVSEATVNLATEQASVTVDPERASFERLREAVNEAGYDLSPPRTHAPDADAAERAARERADRRTRAKVVTGVVLSALVMLGSMPEVFP